MAFLPSPAVPLFIRGTRLLAGRTPSVGFQNLIFVWRENNTLWCYTHWSKRCLNFSLGTPMWCIQFSASWTPCLFCVPSKFASVGTKLLKQWWRGKKPNYVGNCSEAPINLCGALQTAPSSHYTQSRNVDPGLAANTLYNLFAIAS